MICCVCGKKQSGWIQDYPLSEELLNLRICSDCEEQKQKIHANNDVESMEYFKKCLQSATNSEVAEYIGILIRGDNVKEELNKLAHEKAEEESRLAEELLLTTGDEVFGKSVVRYHSLVSGEIALGTGFLSELGASFADFFGVESERFSYKLNSARFAAEKKMRKEAVLIGANAIIGVQFNYVRFTGNIIGVVTVGTAVTIQ